MTLWANDPFGLPIDMRTVAWLPVLQPLAADGFFVAGAPLRIKFVKNEAGEVTALRQQKHFSLWMEFPKRDQTQ
jgi:hypothetical protein